MRKSYVYKSVALHIAVFLLCFCDIPFLTSKHEFAEQPPIIVNLEDVTISDMTNLPEKAERSVEKKAATRKDRPTEASFKPQQPKPEPEIKEEETPKPEEVPEIKAPTLIEEAPKVEEKKEEPKKESEEPKKEKKKPAPIPQRKPQIKPIPQQEPKKKPEPKKPEKPKVESKPKEKPQVRNANALQSLMNSVDDLQKQIGEQDAPAQIPYEEPVNNLGVEGGNSKGSYFSELSVSGIDFVRSKIQESWKTIAGTKDDRNTEVVINVKLTKEGIIQTVDIEDMSRYRKDATFKALADSAERAIIIAQDSFEVFKVLAKQNGMRYNDWKEIRFTFTPLGLTK